jgi:hypothetical protein
MAERPLPGKVFEFQGPVERGSYYLSLDMHYVTAPVLPVIRQYAQNIVRTFTVEGVPLYYPNAARLVLGIGLYPNTVRGRLAGFPVQDDIKNFRILGNTYTE